MNEGRTKKVNNLGNRLGINEVVSAMCRGVVFFSSHENHPTANKECDDGPDSASEAFHPAATLDALHRGSVVANNCFRFEAQSVKGLQLALSGLPHSACHVVAVL